MANEFCPKCSTLTDMNITETERCEDTIDGKVNKVIATSYHCNVCHTFVRSEEKLISVNQKESA